MSDGLIFFLKTIALVVATVFCFVLIVGVAVPCAHWLYIAVSYLLGVPQ